MVDDYCEYEAFWDNDTRLSAAFVNTRHISVVSQNYCVRNSLGGCRKQPLQLRPQSHLLLYVFLRLLTAASADRPVLSCLHNTEQLLAVPIENKKERPPYHPRK